MRNKIIVVSISFVLFIISIINILSPIKDISYSERRKLAGFPEISVNSIINGEFTKELEQYSLDQFVFRDKFRSLKAYFDLSVLNKTDNNNIYLIDGNVFKMEYPLKIDSVSNMGKKMNQIYDLYLNDMNVFYSIIPDKNYFVKNKNKYLTIDYKRLEEIMSENINNMKYINIMDQLELDDYYKTDTHWRQERLGNVVSTIARGMEFEKDLNDIEYSTNTYSPFYGVYYGQSALNIKPDSLTYLTTDNMKNISVYNLEGPQGQVKVAAIYDKEKLGKMDSYDVFLSGATPLLTIDNPSNPSDKELIIFRDSFASSLAPLLIEEYSRITMVDLRYINHESLDDFIEFSNQDVLFLYSTLIINNSNILK